MDGPLTDRLDERNKEKQFIFHRNVRSSCTSPKFYMGKQCQNETNNYRVCLFSVVNKVAVGGEDDLAEVHTKVQKLAEDTAVALKKNVYKNYSQFIETAKEISSK